MSVGEEDQIKVNGSLLNWLIPMAAGSQMRCQSLLEIPYDLDLPSQLQEDCFQRPAFHEENVGRSYPDFCDLNLDTGSHLLFYHFLQVHAVMKSCPGSG